MDRTHIFMMVRWNTNPISTELWYKKLGAKTFQRMEVVVGDNFNIRIGKDNYCIGSDYERGKWLTCVEVQERDNKYGDLTDIKLYGSSTQCYRCSGSEYFTCRMLCQGDVCTPTTERARKLCEPPNTSVYLTHVGGELKVGVSLGIPRRWIEQGSDLGTVVAKAPGLEARRIEHQAAEELDLKLQVRNTTKIKNLENIDLQSAKKELRTKIDEIKPIIEDILKNIPGGGVDDPNIITLSQYYGDFSKIDHVQEVEVVPGAEFGGRIKGIKGTILIVQQGMYYYAMDLKRLESSSFQFLDRPAMNEGQSSLVEWF